MKWRERGIEVMNKIIDRNYLKYLFKSKKNILILLFMISFVCIPFISILMYSDELREYTIQYAVMMSCVLAMLFSVGLPIYLFEILYHKRSCDLYFSLPIKKQTLFCTILLFNFIAVLGCICINYYIYILPFSNVIHTELSNIMLYVLIPLIIVISCICTQLLVTFICIRSNNILDTLFILIGHVLAPVVIYAAMIMFLSSKADLFVLGNGNYIAMLDTVFMHFLEYTSLPFIFFSTIFKILYNQQMTNLFYGAYWIVLSMVVFYLSYRYFVRRKAEESGKRTSFIFGYPYIITIIIFGLIFLAQCLHGIAVIVFLTVIFMLYLFMIFFSNRKISLNYRMVGLFVILIMISYGIGYVFVQTKGFYLVKEIPNLKNIEGITIQVSKYSDTQDLQSIRLEGGKVKEFIDDTVQIHEKSLEYINRSNFNFEIIFIYQYKNGNTSHRIYYIDESTSQTFLKDYFKKYSDSEYQKKGIILQNE